MKVSQLMKQAVQSCQKEVTYAEVGETVQAVGKPRPTKSLRKGEDWRVIPF